MKKVVSVFLMICFALLPLFGCSSVKSDEDTIKSRINSFSAAYNSGDLDSVMDCLDAKTRNTYKAAISLSESLGNAFSGVGLNFSDLFGISVGIMSDNDLLVIEILQINISDDKNATVNVKIGYKDKKSELLSDAVFIMVKEKGNWYIQNLKNK